MSPSLEIFDIDYLDERVTGDVIAPGDPDYDLARRLFTGTLDPKPAAIVKVVDAADIAATIRYTQATGMEFAVRSGGHSSAGHSTSEGGVVIDVRGLNDIDVDTGERTMWAGSGNTAAQVTQAAAAHGLAIGFGDMGSVGIGGITLGGGVGFLSRKHGLTIDSLLAAEMVTATGEVLTVDALNHPDLFWAIRGGGGNFGVVTGFKYRLVPVDRVVGGLIVLPATPDVVAGFLSLSEEGPDELTTIANVMSCPPMPFVPEEVVGDAVIMGLIVWCGDLDEGHRVMDRFRALATPLADMLAEMSYPDIYGPEDEEYRPLAVALTGFTSGVETDDIEAILDAIADSDAPMRVVQLRVLGGAIARVPTEATAFGHRDRAMMLNVASFYTDEEDRPRRETWVRDLWTRLTGGDPAGYVGFLAAEGSDRVRAAYPGQIWDRLRRVKTQYDPANLFQSNQNIPPAHPLPAGGSISEEQPEQD